MKAIAGTDNQQTTPEMTLDNQEPTATTHSDTRISTVSIRQPTPDNQQQTTATDRYTRQPNPTPDKRQLKTHRKKIQQEQLEATTPSPVLSTHNPPLEAVLKEDAYFVTNFKTTTPLCFFS